MSRLDNSVKPILISLMGGTRPLHSLNDEERRILARWAGKTAIVESYAIEAENPLDTKYLNALRRDEGEPPWKFGVQRTSSIIQRNRPHADQLSF